MKKLNTTVKLIRRSPYQAMAALATTTITFFVLTVFALIVGGSTRILAFFESRPQVSAYFKDDATDNQVNQIKKQIESKVSVESMKYISKDDALEIYKSQNQDNPLLLEMVTADILPASLEVSAKNVDDLEAVANIMQNDSSVEEVVFQKDVIDTLKKWVIGIRYAGGAIVGLLMAVSLSTVAMILGLKFVSKKTEIKTMSLLGASPWYIRGPFVLEGIIYSVLGVMLGWGLAYIALLYATPNLVDFLTGIPLLPVPVWVMGAVLGAEFALGIILGGLSSLIAASRYGK